MPFTEIENKQVFTEIKDFTVSSLKDMFDDGDIITNPDYQRDYVYDDKRASKLVESMLMGIPLPTVYFSEEDDGSYSVIDGQQRLTSIQRYLKNDFSLCSLLELSDLNGQYYKDLGKQLQKRLKSTTIRTIVLLKQSQELKYEIFARLNQGSVSLKPQELRNCIYRGPFNTLLDDLAQNKLLEILFHDKNLRKSYQERILRFFALRDFNSYKSSINKTMNSYMHVHRYDSEEDLQKLKKNFNSTIDIIKQVLGADAFFAYERESNKLLEKFSGSVYDSIIIPFSYFESRDLIYHADEIRKAINNLKQNDSQYREDTYASTGSKKRVRSRIMAVTDILHKIIGSYSSEKESRTFSDEVKRSLFKPGYICSYCGNEILSIDDAEVDHIIPFSKGGKTDISNAQLLHRHCNREKNDSLDDALDNFEDESSD